MEKTAGLTLFYLDGLEMVLVGGHMTTRGPQRSQNRGTTPRSRSEYKKTYQSSLFGYNYVTYAA